MPVLPRFKSTPTENGLYTPVFPIDRFFPSGGPCGQRRYFPGPDRFFTPSVFPVNDAGRNGHSFRAAIADGRGIQLPGSGGIPYFGWTVCTLGKTFPREWNARTNGARYGLFSKFAPSHGSRFSIGGGGGQRRRPVSLDRTSAPVSAGFSRQFIL